MSDERWIKVGYQRTTGAYDVADRVDRLYAAAADRDADVMPTLAAGGSPRHDVSRHATRRIA